MCHRDEEQGIGEKLIFKGKIMRKISFSVLLAAIVAVTVAFFSAGNAVTSGIMQDAQETKKADAQSKGSDVTGSDSTASTIARNESDAERPRIIVYYFHGTHRCSTCLRMEEYSKEAIESFFAKELKEGVIEFKPVNTDTAENRHFIQDFQLYTRSLVLVRYDGDHLTKYENLTDIWSFSSNRTKFHLYVKNELEKFMKEGK